MGKMRTCPCCGTKLEEKAQGESFLSIAEAAAHWGVSRDLVYELVRDGKLDAIRFGRTYRIPAGALETYEQRNNAAAREAERERAKAMITHTPVLRI